MQHLHGVITTAQLEQAGITKDCLPRRPEYKRLAKGHYALPGARRDFRFQAALALSIAGEDARLTSDSCLHAAGVLKDAPRRVRLVVAEGKGSRKRREADVRRSSHLPEEVFRYDGLASVPTAYAVTDFARDAPDRSVAFAISGALGLRVASLEEIVAVADDRGRFPGSARLRRVLADYGEAETHSARERLLRRALARLGVSPADAQIEISGPDGRVVRKADIAFLEEMLDVEVDGPHHFSPRQQAKDRAIDRVLRSLGWDVIRFSVYEIDADVDACARQVVAILESRRRLLGLAA